MSTAPSAAAATIPTTAAMAGEAVSKKLLALAVGFTQFPFVATPFCLVGLSFGLSRFSPILAGVE